MSSRGVTDMPYQFVPSGRGMGENHKNGVAAAIRFILSDSGLRRYEYPPMPV